MALLLPWLFVLLAQSGAAPATPASSAEDLARHVQVTLSIRDGKTAFRGGEPIRLIASFTADRPGYQVDTTIDKHARVEDQILMTPEKGVFHWRELLSTPDSYGRDYGSRSNLSAQPVNMTLPLNYWFRFDEPGEYTVRVRTRRVSTSVENSRGPAAPWLTTNEVTFKIVPMTEQEEEIEARRLSAQLDSMPANDLTVQTERCEDLAFLAGDAGTREKVRRFLQPQGRYAGNWIADLGIGLYISRSTSLVISLLEEEMRDPTKPAAYISNLTDLRVWMEMPALVADAQGDMNALRARRRARLDAIRLEYVNEAIASLSQRTGAARRNTATYLLPLVGNSSSVPLPPGVRRSIPDSVRTIIVDEFAELAPFDQAALVQMHWKDIGDAKLLPALEKMTTSTDPWVRGMPMTAILELAPDRAKPIFLGEMLAPRSVASNALLGLRDETLPELDRPLLDQITGLTASANVRDAYQLEAKTRFLARYATASVLTDVQRLYETSGARLEQDVRVNLLAYLDRWDEAGGSERLEHSLAAGGDSGMLLYHLAAVRYSKAVDAVLRVRLNSADPSVAEGAASLMARHGPADGRKAIEARLAQWMNEWSGLREELEPDPKTLTPQGRLQISLIRALLDGKSWKFSDADAQKLKQSCATEGCRKAFAVR